MIYLTPQKKPPSYIIESENWGQLLSPDSRQMGPRMPRWAADCGAYTGKTDIPKYLEWLNSIRSRAYNCLFCVVPDVLFDPRATQINFALYHRKISEMGFPLAFVCQDGMENLTFPNPKLYHAIFIGGSTKWKMSEGAKFCIEYGLIKSKHVHVGRVNSTKRLRIFAALGAHSVDGTTVCFQPDARYADLDKCLEEINL